jgi:type VI protein secretion system component VasK
MDHQRPGWRIRISTLMLLVIIAAVFLTLAVERWKWRREEQRLIASQERALAQAQQAEARAQQAQVQARKAIVRARDSVRRAYQNPGGERTKKKADKPERAEEWRGE